MWGAITAGISGHFSGRSRSWWTGPNSVIGGLGLGSDESYNIPERKNKSEINPLIYVAVAYFIFK